MKIIQGGRRFGKTTRLIEMSRDSGASILTFNRLAAERIVQCQANEMKIKIPPVLTMMDLVSGNLKGLKIKGLLIDEIELCLNQLISLPIEAGTLTGEIIQLAMPEHMLIDIERMRSRC